MSAVRESVVIHHNPACGTSHTTLAIIEAAGYRPTVIEYLETGWTRPQLLGLFAAAALTPRDALRENEAKRLAPDLLATGASDDDLLSDMVSHPILVNRPIVCTPRGVRLCRPAEAVLDLLDRLPPGPLRNRDGKLLIDEVGRRVA